MEPTAPSEPGPTLMDYCICIYLLREDGSLVSRHRIADCFGVTRQRVYDVTKSLVDHDLASSDGRLIALTDRGESFARQGLRRRGLAECFLTEVLGQSWADAHQEAARWQHTISPEVEPALAALLGHPTTCPHGNPIPGADHQASNERPLTELEVDEHFTVTRIAEVLTFTPHLLEFLQRSWLVPGQTGRLVAAAPDGTVTIATRDAPFGVGPAIGSRTFVTA